MFFGSHPTCLDLPRLPVHLLRLPLKREMHSGEGEILSNLRKFWLKPFWLKPFWLKAISVPLAQTTFDVRLIRAHRVKIRLISVPLEQNTALPATA